MRQLHDGDRDAMPIGHGRLFNRFPGLPGAQTATDFAREAQARRFTEAGLAHHGPHIFGGETQRDFCGADIRRLLDDLRQRQRTVRVRIADGRRTDGHLAWRAVDDRIKFVLAAIQRQRGHKRLHRRTRFEAVGHCPITQLPAGQLRTIVRVVGRPVGQRQNLTALDVRDNHAAAFGIEFLGRITQRIESNELNLRIDGQLNILAILRRPLGTHFFDNLATTVLDHRAFARLADQAAFKRQFNAFLTPVILTRKADHVRDHVAGRIEATVFAIHLDARQLQCSDARGRIRRHLMLQIDKTLVTRQFLFNLAWIHFQQCCQLFQLLFIQFSVGSRPDRAHRRRLRQHVAVAIQNLAA